MSLIVSTLAALAVQAGPLLLKCFVDEFFQIDPYGWAVVSSLCFLQISVTSIPGRRGHNLGFCVLCLLFFCTLPNVISIGLFKSPISIITLSTAMQSNPQEAAEFWQTYRLQLGLLVISSGFIGVILMGLYRSWPRPRTSRISSTALILSFSCALPVVYRSINNPKQIGHDFHELAYANRLFTSLARYNGIMAARAEARKVWTSREGVQQRTRLEVVDESAATPLVVVVIGESTTKSHMGIYGYHRQTTPNLAARKDQLVVFKNALSPVASTLPAVLGALCSAGLDKDSWGCRGPTLLEIARSAGYRTTWISNQAPTGFGDNFLAELGRTADTSIFANQDVSSAGEADSGTSFDEKVLGPFHEVVQASKRSGIKSMVFIHLMGTHFVYQKRYPAESRRFQSTDDLTSPFVTDNARAKEIVNHYDNAVAYQDKILAEILNGLDSSGMEALFFYFSDHGEEVYDVENFAGHSEDRVTSSMREVPFVVGYSGSYGQKNASKLNRIKTYEGRQFSTFQLTPSIAGLLGLRYDQFNEQDDIFSDGFVPSQGSISAHRDD